MSIRKKAIPWFRINYPDIDEPVKTSKYYIDTESWTKSVVWWFEFPEEDVDSNLNGYTNLLCESMPGDNNFHFLRVPNEYLNKNKSNLFMREKKDKLVYSLYLSANPEHLFSEQRGIGKIDFSSYLES